MERKKYYYAGAFLAIGAGIGAGFGLVMSTAIGLGAGLTLPLGAAFGAAAGLVIGAAADNHRRKQDSENQQ